MYFILFYFINRSLIFSLATTVTPFNYMPLVLGLGLGLGLPLLLLLGLLALLYLCRWCPGPLR